MSVPHMSFKLGNLLLGVPAEQVIEVSRSAELTRLPFAASHVLGLISLRGTLAVGIDLARCLQATASDAGPQDQAGPGLWVFAQTQQGLVGLRVDAVCDIHVVAPHEVAPAPVNVEGPLGRMVCGTVALPETLMHVLALDEIPLQADAGLSSTTEGMS